MEYDKEVAAILTDITSLEDQNSHMHIPKLWSQTINRSVQELFADFEQATSDWITQIKESVKSDGSDGASEVIGVFQNVLSENLIQHPGLRSRINAQTANDKAVANDKVAQLYRHIMYLQVHPEMPITTGDIFKFADDYFGILISPECELCNKQTDYAFLMISHNAYREYITRQKCAKAANVGWYTTASKKERDRCKDLFHNGELSIHILPSFPFDNANNKAGLISFKTGFKLFGKTAILNNRTNFRLMAPYIHQLRQRFISSFGRYGVSEYPNSLKEHNLNW